MDDEREFRIQSLREFRHIKRLFVAMLLTVLLTAGVVVTGVVVTVVVAYQIEQDSNFQKAAETLFDSNKIEQLQSSVSARLRERPNDVYALYYQAKIHFLAQEWPEAIKVFERVILLEPSWSESVQAYIEAARLHIATVH